jgi:uncharacterized protein YdeI (YjbR/CyaY-like superfamily)
VPANKKANGEYPIISFDSKEQWEKWLRRNHERSHGVWVCFQKKSSGQKSPTHAEALDVALCYGWIDGQAKPHNERSWLQKFTHRRALSGWSKRNTEHAERLIRADQMKPAGLAEIEAAKRDGRWEAAYDSPRNATIPNDFLKELRRDKKALAFFNSLNKANCYAISYRLQTAKTPETRGKRMKTILTMMARGKKFH